MSTPTQVPPTTPSPPPPEPTPLLYPGDRLSRDEFERRYAAMPHVKKAELIEGAVHIIPSPVSYDHGSPHFNVITWLGMYAWATPGVGGCDNGTVRLDLDNEPQPDVFLRVLDTHGGQSRITPDRYIVGAPELVAEIAVSSASIDLHAKFNVYRRNSVREYVVWRVEDQAVDWFILRGSTFERLNPGADGVYRSEHFPGLWLDPAALVRGDYATLSRIALDGIAGTAHTAFVEKLRKAAESRKPT